METNLEREGDEQGKSGGREWREGWSGGREWKGGRSGGRDEVKGVEGEGVVEEMERREWRGKGVEGGME